VSTGFLITWSRRLKAPLVAGCFLVLVGSIGLSVMQPGLPTVIYLLFLMPSSMGQGFQFPATFMCVLATSPQHEQAVVTSTLILWRQLGMVLGVASSSLIVQNALVVYLNWFVKGPNKADIIEMVRKSVQAISELDPTQRAQVVTAYAASLRVTFMFAVVISAVMLAMVVGIKLPRLKK
jgi:hypothetical protein